MTNDDKKIIYYSAANISLIVWAVFMILGYGFNVTWLANRFWIYFSLWIIPAISLIILIIYFTVKLISDIISDINFKRKSKKYQTMKNENHNYSGNFEPTYAAPEKLPENTIDARLRVGLSEDDSLDIARHDLISACFNNNSTHIYASYPTIRKLKLNKKNMKDLIVIEKDLDFGQLLIGKENIEDTMKLNVLF